MSLTLLQRLTSLHVQAAAFRSRFQADEEGGSRDAVFVETQVRWAGR